MSQPPYRPIKRLLIANRGEIATRIISTARELDIETYSLYTENDSSHTLHSTHSIKLPSPSSYLDISALISIVQKHDIDTIHPGYGFLSESPKFAERMWKEANAIVIGPGPEILERTGDKLMARQLANECHVPILPALQTSTNDIFQLHDFASSVGYPIIIKAVDGGGGRGIRIVTQETELEDMLKAALRESPSKKVFAEKAAIDGYRHVEVQIIGDGKGGVRHLWERECSIQRRFQKVVEFAPSGAADRDSIGRVIDAALRMAKKVNYYSLGTFEFLVRQSSPEFYFLEINPRLQVEHTITESLALGIDLVKIQLLLAEGHSLPSLLPRFLPSSPSTPPEIHSLQLRITAESPSQDFSISPGKISSFHFPSGNGIRVDTHLHPSTSAVIGTDFDSLLAKLIITAPTWLDVIAKAKRALDHTFITGIETNLNLLRAIVASDDFRRQKCDTRWLKKNLPMLLESASNIGNNLKNVVPSISTTQIPALPISSNVLFRPRDAWDIFLTPENSKDGSGNTSQTPYHLQITRILTNNFPSLLKANILFTSPSSTSSSSKPTPYTLSLTSSTSSSSQQSSQNHRLGNLSNPNHITAPFPGKLIEIYVETGDRILAGQAICVIRQMKMEVEIRSKKGGIITWVLGDEEEEEVWEVGLDVREGVLICELEDEDAFGRDSKL
ncbi:f351a645-9ae0-4417-9230-d85cebacd79f [Sclerotinia trifoliorum]|uniref:F351a645-9ae0-4417-9230-d85cebacd79f n=1 Tax=Sclerotinia trifoliorum TaxID=28548 RepID=A0A8H2VSE9_9HELO|nr:f351a645-9ae0-4417-9230-d85cebacd79f [Sclerotinia trifoliorum]